MIKNTGIKNNARFVDSVNPSWAIQIDDGYSVISVPTNNGMKIENEEGENTIQGPATVMVDFDFAGGATGTIHFVEMTNDIKILSELGLPQMLIKKLMRL